MASEKNDNPREIPVTDQLSIQLNTAYDQYIQSLNSRYERDSVIGFSRHLKQRYGLELRLEPRESNYGLKQVFITDQARYNWFLLEFA